MLFVFNVQKGKEIVLVESIINSVEKLNYTELYHFFLSPIEKSCEANINLIENNNDQFNDPFVVLNCQKNVIWTILI